MKEKENFCIGKYFASGKDQRFFVFDKRIKFSRKKKLNEDDETISNDGFVEKVVYWFAQSSH